MIVLGPAAQAADMDLLGIGSGFETGLDATPRDVATRILDEDPPHHDAQAAARVSLMNRLADLRRTPSGTRSDGWNGHDYTGPASLVTVAPDTKAPPVIYTPISLPAPTPQTAIQKALAWLRAPGLAGLPNAVPVLAVVAGGIWIWRTRTTESEAADVA